MTRKLRKHLILIIPIIAIVIIAFSRSFATLTENTTIQIGSSTVDYNNNDPGSWQIEETAYWDLMDTLGVNVNLDSYGGFSNTTAEDVLFILDMSSSMYYNTDVQNTSNDLISVAYTKLMQNQDNKLASLYFNKVVWKYTDFVHDLNDAVSDSGFIPPYDDVDYSNLIDEIDLLLSNYDNENKPLKIVIVADSLGDTSVNTLSSKMQTLRQDYPYISSVDGISYNTDGYALKDLDAICDNNYVVEDTNEMVSKVEDILSDRTYDDFVIKEYINSNEFEINADYIDASIGDVSIDGNVLTWDLSGVYTPGDHAYLYYVLNINQANVNSYKMFSAHTKHEVISSIDNIDEDITSNDIIVINNDFTVNYLPNTPSGCTVTNMPSSEKHHTLKPFRVNSSEPKCEGYKFKGWKVDTINGSEYDSYYYFNDTYYMPPNDVYFSATWSKLNVTKTESGNITSLRSLYSDIASNAMPDNSVNFSNPASAGRVYQMSSTANDEYPVYYYRGNVNNNNVIFAGLCWRIIRTTSTGGIKLIYNGAASNGTCNNNFATTSIGESPFISHYASDIFDKEKLANYMAASDFEPITYNGYMYDSTSFTWGFRNAAQAYYWSTSLGDNDASATYHTAGQYYADEVTYDSNTHKYTLVNPDTTTSTTTYGDLANKYVSSTITTGFDSVAYYKPVDLNDNLVYKEVIDAVGNTSSTDVVRYYSFKYGTMKYSSLHNYVYGTGYQYSNGEYYLTNTMTVNILDFFETDFTGYYYTCLDNTDHCSDLYYIPTISISSELVLDSLRFFDSNDPLAQEFNQNDSEFTELTVEEQSRILSRYTSTNNPEFLLMYLIFGRFEAPYYYVGTTLSNGATVNDVLSAMSTSNNTYSSDLKGYIENWWYNLYSGQDLDAQTIAYLETSAGKEYVSSIASDYLEDTVFCNDRSISTPSNYKVLNYGSKTRGSSPSLTCPNAADRFTFLSANGNGKLLFPIGTITKDELTLTAWPEYADSNFWTMSPATLDLAFMQLYSSSGHQVLPYIPLDVKPVVSLKSGIKASSGIGTADNPYVILVQNGG